jgi:hypothetical protein
VTAQLRKYTTAEEGQGTFEYLIVTGIFAVALVSALLAFDALIVEVVGHVCPSVDTANVAVTIGSCIGLTP